MSESRKPMKPGESWSSWKALFGMPMLALPMLLFAPGCVKDRASVERSLLIQPALEKNEVARSYRVGCPDIIELAVTGREEFTGRYEVSSDGKLNLGDYGKPRIEGRTLPEIANLIGAEIGVSPANVDVRVSEFRSQHVLLFGEVIGSQRSVPYLGAETVLGLLQRVGGITPGAAPDDVYVVRPHVGDNRRPEVFHVDLNAIVMKQDQKTNLRVMPYDQIYVGETRQAKIGKALPPWLRVVYQAVSDTKPKSPVRPNQP